jgi:hypothetical protein
LPLQSFATDWVFAEKWILHMHDDLRRCLEIIAIELAYARAEIAVLGLKAETRSASCHLNAACEALEGLLRESSGAGRKASPV